MFDFLRKKAMNQACWPNVVVISSIILGSIVMSSDGWGPAPRTAKIAFTSVRDGNYEIYVMDVDGKNPRNLTNHAGSDDSPAWSPDGRRIAFYSSRPEGSGLYVMDADGSNPRYLAPVGCCPDPAWSPDGKKIAFAWRVEGLSMEIGVIDVDGGTPRILTNNPFSDESPTWSPDGRQIAFKSTRDGISIYVMDSDGSNQRLLAKPPPETGGDSYPAWSPDGKKIVFESSRKNGKADIYVMNADGTNRRRLTKHLAHDRFPAWSPDGEKIVFYSERDGGIGEIYVMDANGNNQQNLTNHPWGDGFRRASWFDPAFALSVSPVGKRIVSWGEVKVKQ